MANNSFFSFWVKQTANNLVSTLLIKKLQEACGLDCCNIVSLMVEGTITFDINNLAKVMWKCIVLLRVIWIERNIRIFEDEEMSSDSWLLSGLLKKTFKHFPHFPFPFPSII